MHHGIASGQRRIDRIGVRDVSDGDIGSRHAEGTQRRRYPVRRADEQPDIVTGAHERGHGMRADVSRPTRDQHAHRPSLAVVIARRGTSGEAGHRSSAGLPSVVGDERTEVRPQGEDAR